MGFLSISTTRMVYNPNSRLSKIVLCMVFAVGLIEAIRFVVVCVVCYVLHWTLSFYLMRRKFNSIRINCIYH